MPQFLANIDLNKNQLQNALIHVLAADPGSPTEGQIYYNSVSKTLRIYSGSAWVVLGRLDQISSPTAAVAMNAQLITGLATPVSGTDAATKAYVDALSQGINWKAPVRAATTANGTLASAFANASIVDGVTLVTGDRILLKNQTAGQENGIYVVAASGAPTRATDADTAAEILQAAVFVQEGTVNADILYVNSTNAPITLGTTPLVFAQIGGATTYTSANGGITIAGTVVTAVAGTGITIGVGGISLTAPVTVPLGGTGQVALTANTVLLGNGTSAVALAAGTADQVLRIPGAGGAPAFGAIDLTKPAAVTGALPIANGGTGATTAATARTALGAVAKYAASVGNNVLTSITVNHNLGTSDVQVMVFRVGSPFDKVYPDIQITDANNVTLVFAVAPTTNQFRCVVQG